MGTGLRFDDRVVLVTGAGNGLGRSHALMFAARGAKVVVNDLGGSAFGEGKSSTAADAVVAEIKAAGGEAVANYDSVEDGDKLVQTAMDTWGRIDVVINNAGILRDVSFHKMTEDDWDLIYRVHVKGTYRVTAAAWPHMREQRYGRIIMTSSGAGIYGNFGQANYSMAKMGVFGFGSTLAVEGAGRNIQVNTIAPIAGSRLTETVLPKEVTDALRPEFVSPLVGWLCHEDCEETGGLFEVGGGYFAKLRWERTKGKTVRIGRSIQMDDIKKDWDLVTRFDDGATHPSVLAAAMGPVMENIQAGPSLGGNDLIDVDLALGYEFPPETTEYSEHDLTVYALGIGAGSDPMNQNDLQYVYERHGQGFKALPTFGVIPAMKIMMQRALEGVSAPGLNYSVDRLLHGEQFMELVRPLPPTAKLTHRAKIKEIWDKGKGAIVNMEIKSFDEEGDLLVRNEFVSFIRGAGGFGGERGPSNEINLPPKREPDAVVEETIGANQAIIYRLSGDWNPLHVDPGFAQAFGFDKPILHGLCTFGYASRHVINSFCDGDPRFFKNIKVRFAQSVFPGETVVTRMWKESSSRIVFECHVKERDTLVLSNAAIELYDEIPVKAPKTESSAIETSTPVPTTPISADIFNGLAAYVEANQSMTTQIGKVYQFKLSAPKSVWTLDLKSGSVQNGESTKPDCTLELSDSDFMAMCMGEADPQQLYFGGQLQISGDIMASQKLNFLQKVERHYFEDSMTARAGGGAETPASGAETSQSADAFLGIHAHVAEHPELAEKIQTVFAFKLTDPDSAWTLDLKTGSGGVIPGLTGQVDCTLELSDSDFLDMVKGIADPQQLYFGGQLKISGNIMASQKLSFLQSLDPEAVALRVAELKAQGQGFEAQAVADSPEITAIAPGVFTQAQGIQSHGPDTVLGFQIHNPDAAFTVRISGNSIDVLDGLASDVVVTMTMADADLGSFVAGDISAQALHQKGLLRIDGDVLQAHRIGFLVGLSQ